MTRSRVPRVRRDPVADKSFPLHAASRPRRSSLRLQSLSSCLKGVSAFFLLQDLRAPQGGPKTIVCRRRPTTRRKKTAHNVWLIGCELILTAGVTDSCGMCAEQDMDSTEYIAEAVFKGTSLLESDLHAGHPVSRLTVLRPKGTRRCPPSFVREMLTLVSAIHRELEWKGPRVELRMQEHAAVDLFEKVPIGIALLDSKRDVVLQNTSAQDILGSAESSERRSAGPLDTIRSALDQGFLTKHPSGGCLCLFQPIVAQRSCAFAYPIATGSYVGKHKPTTAIFLTSPNRGVVTSGTALTRLYGLTRAEARLTSKLLQGRRITESARQLGISVNTARNQLKRIFSKTATHRQSDLLNLLCSISGTPSRLSDKDKTKK